MRRFRRGLTSPWLLGAVLAVALALASPAAQTVAIDRAQVLKDLEVLAADDMQGREVGTAGGAKARAYLIERFKASGIPPLGASYEQPFPLPQGRGRAITTGVNVVGRIEGREIPGRHIVLSAHYDHVGVNGGRVFNGADDNASGTAALVALGAYFRAHPLRHSLLVVAFDGEERGLSGSRAFVKNPPVDRSTIVLNLNADMVGRDAKNRLYVSGTFEQPALKPPVARVAARAPVTLLMGYDNPKAPESQYWMTMSDQWSFREANIPALYIGVEDFEHLHKATDDYANMTHDFFVNAVVTIGLLVQEFDRAMN